MKIWVRRRRKAKFCKEIRRPLSEEKEREKIKKSVIKNKRNAVPFRMP